RGDSCSLPDAVVLTRQHVFTVRSLRVNHGPDPGLLAVPAWSMICALRLQSLIAPSWMSLPFRGLFPAIRRGFRGHGSAARRQAHSRTRPCYTASALPPYEARV